MRRPRLAERHVAEGEKAQQALAVARADRAGVVDGVHVDFRHPGLPPGEWEARAWWNVGSDGECWSGFLFPSEAAACEATLDDELSREKLLLPRAFPGDRLTVESVVDDISHRRFDHRHDATTKHAYLVLTRQDGSQVRPSSPLAFYGVTQLRDGPSRDAYDRLAERVLGEHGNLDPHCFEVRNKIRPEFDAVGRVVEQRPVAEFSLSERAALAVEQAEQAWLKLVSQNLKDDPQGQAYLRVALNNAVLAAFFQAKHESQPAEDRAQRVEEGGDKARRQAKAKDGRLEKAALVWAKSPTLTANAVAVRVSEEIYAETRRLLDPSGLANSFKRAHVRGDLAIPVQSPSHPDNKDAGA